MRARPFLAAVLAVAVALLSAALAGWWLLWQHSPLALQTQRLELPLAARFVPRTAPLSLHWLVAPDQPAAYARAVARPRQRREAAAAADRLKREGIAHITCGCIIASRPGVKRMREAHPDITLYGAALDEALDERGYITPGLGDAGDRIFGT